MRTTTAVKMMAFIAFLVVISAAGVKNVAVVESDIDEQSGASEKLTRADVRLVTAELRREAVKNLPANKYNIMTSETVIAQGGAVLEECADENCVISLGSKIGADYIVRGTLSKVESRFTLTVEMYETENGNLVASSDPVRSESIGDLIEKAAEACGNMYRTWVAAQMQISASESAAKKSTRERSASKISIVGGAFFANDFGGGANWGGNKVGIPFYGGGAYIALDITYAAIFIDYTQGGGKWIAPSNVDPDDLPDMRRSSLNFGVFAKYPNIKLGESMNMYPIVGVRYELPVSCKLEYKNEPEYVFDGNNNDGYTASAFSALWVKIGGGADFYLTPTAYIRAETLYGVRTANKVEKDGSDKTRLGHGLTVKVGAGFKL